MIVGQDPAWWGRGVRAEIDSTWNVTSESELAALSWWQQGEQSPAGAVM